MMNKTLKSKLTTSSSAMQGCNFNQINQEKSMIKQKTRIPIATITIADPSVSTDDDNYEDGSEELSFDNPLLEFDELRNASKVAHLTLHKIDQHLIPASAELFWINGVTVDTVDGEEGISFQFKPAEVLESGSFQVKYGYDYRLEDYIPQYIILG